MGKIISISNQKGGVGKTTTSVNVSASLAKSGKKTLLIDLDPQGNATSGVGFDKKNLKFTSYDILTTDTKSEEAVEKTDFKNLFIIPANINLAAAESQLMRMEKREYKLKEKIFDLKKSYDYIIIDCPPSLGALTINALCACDSVLIPIQCEFYALEGLSQLINTIKIIKRQINPFLEIEGILMTMYDLRLNLTKQVEKELQKNFPEKIFSVGIPRSVKLSEAPSFGKPSCYFDRWGKGTLAYMRLAKEIIKNNFVEAKRFK